ncbi:DUF502 domain-containing protein [Rhodobacteraceae bacterium DSL-40]|uniref:DUF502 domain-containing protein n=1 Tax=Amaricoccus sp. B4 TaxID=3368557 RepID=UPI000DAD2A7F
MARKPIRRRKGTPKPPLLQRLRGDFLTGLVVVLPVFLTIYLLWATIGFIDAKVIPLIPNRYNPENVFGRNIFGFGVVVFLTFTTLVGALTKGFIGRKILHTGERMVERMPIVRSLYNGLKQIVETIFSQTNNSFQNACLIEYPRKGLWAVAFVSTDTSGEIRERAGADELVSVFLPTTPNPTSGFLLFVPREDIVYLDMSIEEAAKLIISAGLVEPPYPRAAPARGAKSPPPAAKRASAPAS